MENSELYRKFRFVFWFSSCGDPEFRGWKQKIFLVYSYIVRTVFVAEALGIILHLDVTFKNMHEDVIGFAFCFSAIIGASVAAIKMVLCKRQKIKRILKQMFIDDKIINTSSDKDFREQHSFNTSRFLIIVKFNITAMISSMSAFSALSALFYLNGRNCGVTEHCKKSLVMDAYVPFDLQQYHGWALFIHYLGIVSLGLFLLYVDVVFVALIVNPIFKLKILQYVLRNFDSYARKIGGHDDAFNEKSQLIFFQCIIEHQKIIRECEELKENTSSLFFIDFFSSSLKIAPYCFIIMSDKSETYFKVMVFCCLMYVFFQLFIIYWLAQLLAEESVKISDCVYNSKWFDVNLKNQKNLLHIMRRSQKHLALRVGPFYEMNLQVFLKILKTIYTYITLFRAKF